MLGLRRHRELCHAAESALQAVQEGRNAWSVQLVAELWAALDHLQRQLAENRLLADESIAALAARLTWLSGGPPQTSNDLPTGEPAIAPKLFPAVDEFPIHLEVSAHRDADVYRICALQALRSLDCEDVWLTTQLARVAAQVSRRRAKPGFAETLWDALRGHSAWSGLDCVCLTRIVAESNRLQVVDSHCGAAFPFGLLTAADACFVPSKDSLGELTSGAVRIFAESGAVVRPLPAEQSPLQRFCAVKSTQGVRSGICLPVVVGDRSLGFLFLQSRSPQAFSGVEHRCAPLLALLPILAGRALDDDLCAPLVG